MPSFSRTVRKWGTVVVVFALLAAGAYWWFGRRATAEDFVPPPEWLTPLPTYPAWIPTATLTPTATQPPTATPTATPTLTPTPPPPSPTPTPTLIWAVLVANGNLYCRQGPGPYFLPEAVLQPGQRAQVLGSALFGPDQKRYWFVALPDTRLCWVRDNERFMTFEGPGAEAREDLPLFPTPYPPEVAFTVAFAGWASCQSRQGWLFNITNYGTLPIESVEITVREGGSESLPVAISWWVDCRGRSRVPAILPGRSALVTISASGRGRVYTATARVCARDHFGEPCVEQTFSFRP